MRLGFIGLGIMGESMAENLINKSALTVNVFDIDPSKTEKLAALGGRASKYLKELVAESDIIFSMVPKSEHVEGIFHDIKYELNESKIWVDMSTIEPHLSQQIAEEVEKTGAIMLDAPVVKSKAAAMAGKLGIYVGGCESAFVKVKPFLAMMGENIIRMGENGKGLYMKIAHNMLVAQIQNGVNEMLVFSEKAGLNLDEVPLAISYGGGQNFYLDSKKESILKGDFTTAFSVENMHKDVSIAVDIKNTKGLKLKGFDVVKSIYDDAMELGVGKKDFSATYKVVKEKQ